MKLTKRSEVNDMRRLILLKEFLCLRCIPSLFSQLPYQTTRLLRIASLASSRLQTKKQRSKSLLVSCQIVNPLAHFQ